MARKEFYIKKHKVPFNNFVSLNSEKIISGDYISDSKLLNELFGYYEFTMSLNRFIERMRLPNLPLGANDMKKVIEIIETTDYIKKSKELIKELQNEV